MGMSAKFHCKIKAVQLIILVASAEVRQFQQGAHFSYGTEQMKALKALTFGHHAAEHIKELMTIPKVQEQVRIFAERMRAITPEMSFLEQPELVAQGIEALLADLNFQNQSKLVIEQIDAMLSDPSLQEQAKLIARRIEAILVDQKLQEQANYFAELTPLLLANAKKHEMVNSVVESNLQDKIVDKIVAETFNKLFPEHVDLENLVFGKPSSLAVHPRLGVRSFTAASSIPVWRHSRLPRSAGVPSRTVGARSQKLTWDMHNPVGLSPRLFLGLRAIQTFSKVYLVLLFVRVLLTWLPRFDWNKKPWSLLRQITDPYLDTIRGLVPKLMGKVDLSPMIGFYLFSFFTNLLNILFGNPELM